MKTSNARQLNVTRSFLVYTCYFCIKIAFHVEYELHCVMYLKNLNCISRSYVYWIHNYIDVVY